MGIKKETGNILLFLANGYEIHIVFKEISHYEKINL
jgi:hypothetical protein